MVKGSIDLRDNVTSTLRKIKKEQESFRRDVKETSGLLKKTYSKTIKVKTDVSPVKRLKKELKSLKTKIQPVVDLKDKAINKIKKVKAELKGIAGKVISPVVKLKDGLGNIKNKLLGGMKSLVLPATIAIAGGVAAIGKSVAAGMELENQQVSMKHFISATNKVMGQAEVDKVAKEFTNALRENANATPFETGDVMAAGSRALSIASGNTKEAMNLIKLSEDMAAASGGTKSISDAIEALADAKLGEMERLKEFGFKVSADEFKKKGFAGVSKDLGDFYGGAAEKLAKTGSGLMSTIKGKLKSNIADFGLKIVEKLKPVLEKVIGIFEKSQPVMEKFSGIIADSIGSGIEKVMEFIPKLISAMEEIKPTIDEIVTVLSPIVTDIVGGIRKRLPEVLPTVKKVFKTIANIIADVAPKIKDLVTKISPIIEKIVDTVSELIPVVMPIIESIFTTVTDIIDAAAPIIKGTIDVIKEVFEDFAPVVKKIIDSVGKKIEAVVEWCSENLGWLGDIVKEVFPIVADTISAAWDIISPIIDTAGEVLKTLYDIVKTVFNGIKDTIINTWETIKPIIEEMGKIIPQMTSGFDVAGIKKGLGTLQSDMNSGKFNASVSTNVTRGNMNIGANASGTNNWQGGLTWVGERGPELLEVPKGARILPHKESVNFSSQQSVVSAGNKTININIPKLADSIVVRSDDDIDRIGNMLADKLVVAAGNMA